MIQNKCSALKPSAVISFLLIFLFSVSVNASDVLIEADGDIRTSETNNYGNVKVVGASGEHAIAGEASGTGAAGVFGISLENDNYGALGSDGYGVVGYSSGGYAGYFSGNVRVTGGLVIDGAFEATGLTLTEGTISESYIDTVITRDAEIMSIVKASDGPGSGLDADTLDGKDSTAFSAAADHAALAARVSTLEAEEIKSFVTNTARVVSDKAYTSEPELERWIKAAQKGRSDHLQMDITEIDTDGDGAITVGTDMTNIELGLAGVVTTFIYARTNMGEMSPWNDALPLWINAGPAANQNACNVTAASNPGQITLCFSPWESSAIKNIFLSAVDYNGVLFYKKSVSGFSDVSKRKSIVEFAKEGAEELKDWIKAVQKGGTFHIQAAIVEVDSNGDGVVIEASDLSNAVLSTSGVVSQFVASRVNMGQRSPWNIDNHLWVNGGAALNQEACTVTAAASTGQITLCYGHAQDNTIKRIYVSAFDNDPTPNLLYEKSIAGLSEAERNNSAKVSAIEGAEELEKWIKAVQRGGPIHPHRNLTEVDTDGNGMVTIGTDMTNQLLATAGVITQFIISKKVTPQPSPWNASKYLWVEGGVAASKAECNTISLQNPGQITICYAPAQDHAVGHIFLSARNDASDRIYEKTITGTTDSERRDSIIASAKENLAELEKWMAAARKAGTAYGSLTEVDTDGDGVVLAGPDLSNDSLALAGVITSFIGSKVVKGEVSPWPNNYYLWHDGGAVANQWGCDAVAQSNPGQITLCYLPAQDQTIEYIFISVTDDYPEINLIYSKTLSAN